MLGLALLVLAGCGLPPPEGRPPSVALAQEDARNTPLGQAVAGLSARHPGLTGIHALAEARDAFAARVLLARAARKTLDVQYYIWHGDLTGTLLLDELRAAAERGVRVRLLLDDNGTSGLDARLAALHAHPGIEVRLFNPFAVRHPKWIGFLTDFSRANRRMHNKSFTADSQATIVGGRNVGDEYFGAAEGALFADLDVLAIGAVVPEVAADFDRYWASLSSYPVDLILPPPDREQLPALRAAAEEVTQSPAALRYVGAIRDLPSIRQLLDGELALEWAPVRMVSDDPAKGLGRAAPEGLLTSQLAEILDTPERELELVSPYFVPAEAGTAFFAGLARSGVRVRVLTNSLASTDVTAVHAGYARRREDLLAAGVVLYELRRLGPGAGERNDSAGPFGSSGSSLHAKTFAVDRRRVFVGSFNFDPRSANLNTELGFVIESPVLADAIRRAFDQAIPATSYKAGLTADGRLFWTENLDGSVVRHETEPQASLLQRLLVSVLMRLPIEWML
ncbi:phospholipase D family protein [Pseudoroseomonas oryzae]|uniref:Phospholipase D n=2 Tax=Teichococcus oryzae TaxID=1608942 RepID=A0A5B2TM33_9PROT|nr:phospholipase D family protein [Pseudoroseomonas oryzae]